MFNFCIPITPSFHTTKPQNFDLKIPPLPKRFRKVENHNGAQNDDESDDDEMSDCEKSKLNG